MHTLLNCVEEPFSISIQLKRSGNIAIDQQQKRWLMPPQHLAWIAVTAYFMEQNNLTSTDCSAAARIMWSGLCLKVANLTILALCPRLQGTEWQCSSISRSINIKIYTTTAPPCGGSISPRFTKMAAWNIGKRTFPKAAPTLGTIYPSAWSKIHLLTLSRPDVKLTCPTKHFDSSKFNSNSV